MEAQGRETPRCHISVTLPLPFLLLPIPELASCDARAGKPERCNAPQHSLLLWHGGWRRVRLGDPSMVASFVE